MEKEKYTDILVVAIEASESIEKSLRKHYPHSPHSANIALNVVASMNKILDMIKEDQVEEAVYRLQWETLPILFHLQNELEYWITIREDSEAGQVIYDRQMQAIKDYTENLDSILEQDYPYDVSIVVLMYNQYQYTKLCLDSIYQYTDIEGMRVEIITVDNGSSDETTAYINTLPHLKKIRLEANISPSAAFIGIYASEGRYHVYLNNDIIATPRWLENLLRCIKSDKGIAMVAPVLNSISNMQSIPVSYMDPLKDTSELQAFAASYNNSDPTKWEERVRIMPSIDIAVTQLSIRVPADARYYDGFYVDDDLSTVFRRAGLKQVLAKDTFMHHFGSVTIHADSSLLDKYARMRCTYYEKWGVDAWEGMDFNFTVIQGATQIINKDQIKILAVDPNFGSTALQIKNELRKKGLSVAEMYAAVTDLRYLEDAVGVFDRYGVGELTSILGQGMDGEFDIIFFHRPIERYIDECWIDILKEIRRILSRDGRVFFTVANPQYAEELLVLANGGSSADIPIIPTVLSYVSPLNLKNMIEKFGLQVSVISVNDEGVSRTKLSMVGTLVDDKARRGNLSIKEYLFVLAKA